MRTRFCLARLFDTLIQDPREYTDVKSDETRIRVHVYDHVKFQGEYGIKKSAKMSGPSTKGADMNDDKWASLMSQVTSGHDSDSRMNMQAAARQMASSSHECFSGQVHGEQDIDRLAAQAKAALKAAEKEGQKKDPSEVKEELNSDDGHDDDETKAESTPAEKGGKKGGKKRDVEGNSKPPAGKPTPKPAPIKEWRDRDAAVVKAWLSSVHVLCASWGCLWGGCYLGCLKQNEITTSLVQELTHNHIVSEIAMIIDCQARRSHETSVEALADKGRRCVFDYDVAKRKASTNSEVEAKVQCEAQVAKVRLSALELVLSHNHTPEESIQGLQMLIMKHSGKAEESDPAAPAPAGASSSAGSLGVERSKLGSAPPCRSYAKLRTTHWLQEQGERFLHCQSRPEVTQLQEELKPFKAAIAELISLCTSVTKDLLSAVASAVKRIEQQEICSFRNTYLWNLA